MRTSGVPMRLTPDVQAYGRVPGPASITLTFPHTRLRSLMPPSFCMCCCLATLSTRDSMFQRDGEGCPDITRYVSQAIAVGWPS